MFGFPIGNGNAGFNDFVEKFTNNADSGFPKIQQREVFYSIKDGLWSDANTWQTASGRVGVLPTINDDVYIKNIVNFNISSSTTNINNLFISNRLNYSAGSATLIVNGSFIVSPNGIFDISPSAGGALFTLLTNNNYCERQCFIKNTIATSNFNYSGLGQQNILDLDYHNLLVGVSSLATGTKYLTSNLLITGNLNVQGVLLGNEIALECGQYDLTINGTTSLQGKLSKAAEGNLLFIGNSQGKFELTGNPNVEFRGGLSISNTTGASRLTLGNGIISFTTNNQSITGTGRTEDTTSYYEMNNVLIGNGITLTNSSNSIGIFNYINGSNSTSKFTNAGQCAFRTQNAAQNSMTTGLFDFTTSANTIFYQGNYSATITSYFTNFHNLTISGTGTKTLGVNTTLNGILTLSTTGGLLNCSTFNLTVTGVTNFQNGGLQKTGAGNLLFIGNFNSVTGNNTNKIDFSGNPNVELRGGISRGNYDWNGGWNTGTGTWTFTTNNQTFQGASGYNQPCTCKFIVSGAITVTFTGGARTTFADRIDGTVAGSTWINQGRMRFVGTEITPMSTGVFDYLTSTLSYLSYEYNGNLTIPYTSYQGFVVAGTGTKTLSGNTSVAQNFEFNDNVTHTLECGTFNFSVTGISYVNGVVSKTGAGSLLFVGNLTWGGTSGTGSTGGFNLTGNPTLEFRGGITYGTYGMYAATNTGTGQMTFSTNAQTINLGRTSGAAVTINNPILISGAIVVTLNNGTTNTLLAGSINGNNASSTLRIAANATTNYHSATQPMATGVLDTSTNLNTWIYGNGNQDIKGSPTTSPKQVYRNLTLNGGGTKTLQGYVSVQNTYTLTAPATLALNGFTLTNP